MNILPTMGRPEQCGQVLASLIEHGISTPGVVFVNGPDRAAEYNNLRLPNRWSIIHLERNVGVCSAMNIGFKIWPNEPCYTLCCDDEYAMHDGFDMELMNAAGKWNIAHANDGKNSNWRIWGFSTIGGELVRALGWMALPGLFHWFFDDVQETIASDLGLRRFLPHVKCEHRHYLYGASPDDATYASGRSKAGDDEYRFKTWKRDEWPRQREVVRSLMAENP